MILQPMISTVDKIKLLTDTMDDVPPLHEQAKRFPKFLQPSPAHTFAYFNGHILTRTKNLNTAEAGYANLAKTTIQSTILGGLGVGRGASCEAGRGPYQVQYIVQPLEPNTIYKSHDEVNCQNCDHTNAQNNANMTLSTHSLKSLQLDSGVSHEFTV